MNASLISIKPRYSDAIFDGTKTFELRRRGIHAKKGHLLVVYESAPTMAIRGAVEVRSVELLPIAALWKRVRSASGIERTEFDAYFNGRAVGAAIGLGRVFEFTRPITLDALRSVSPGFHPPQSWISLGCLSRAALATILHRSPEVSNRLTDRGNIRVQYPSANP